MKRDKSLLGQIFIDIAKIIPKAIPKAGGVAQFGIKFISTVCSGPDPSLTLQNDSKKANKKQYLFIFLSKAYV